MLQRVSMPAPTSGVQRTLFNPHQQRQQQQQQQQSNSSANNSATPSQSKPLQPHTNLQQQQNHHQQQYNQHQNLQNLQPQQQQQVSLIKPLTPHHSSQFPAYQQNQAVNCSSTNNNTNHIVNVRKTFFDEESKRRADIVELEESFRDAMASKWENVVLGMQQRLLVSQVKQQQQQNETLGRVLATQQQQNSQSVNRTMSAASQQQQQFHAVVPQRVVLDELQSLLRNSSRAKLNLPHVAAGNNDHGDGAAAASSFLLTAHSVEAFCSAYTQLARATDPADVRHGLEHLIALASDRGVLTELLSGGRFSRMKREIDKLGGMSRRSRDEGQQQQQQLQQLQSLSVSCAKAPLFPASVVLAIIREQESADETGGLSSATTTPLVNRGEADVTTAAATFVDVLATGYQQLLATLNNNNNSKNDGKSNIDLAQANLIMMRQGIARTTVWLLAAGPINAATCSLVRRSFDGYGTLRAFEICMSLSDALRLLGRSPSRCCDPATSWPLLTLLFCVVRCIDAVLGVSASSGVRTSATALDTRNVSSVFSHIMLHLGLCRSHARNAHMIAASSNSSSSSASRQRRESAVTLVLFALVTARASQLVVGAPAIGLSVAADWAHVLASSGCCGSSDQVTMIRGDVCRMLEIQESEFFSLLTK